MRRLGGQCQDSKIPKGSTASLRTYQSNSFNNFFSSLIFRNRIIFRDLTGCPIGGWVGGGASSPVLPPPPRGDATVLWGCIKIHVVNDSCPSHWGATYWYVAIEHARRHRSETCRTIRSATDCLKGLTQL